ncbi:hypothetical protein F5Y16DRAFT_387071 [Xylariaceae sp. FL0255]|nr:hypothetical protein F5Y16DRAFT_387071 [Xylariaceae sp. FL0255]
MERSKGARYASTVIKLRSACQQCCTAKVKCSGEKSGCERCRASGAACVYLESRVGKVPGIRARKNRDGTAKDRHCLNQPKPPEAPQPVTPATSSTTEPSSALNKATDQANDSMWWSPDWYASPSSSESITALLPNQSAEMQLQLDGSDAFPSPFDPIGELDAAGDDLHLTEIDGEYEEVMTSDSSPFDMADTSSSQLSHIQQPTPLAVKSGLRARTETDSRCCQDCCQIMMELERYIMLDVKDCNIAMGITKQALDKIVQLVAMQEGLANLRCLMFFATLLTQIIELLEIGLSALTAEEARQQRRTLVGGSIGLGFDVFSLETEAQSSFRSQAILKQVEKATEIMRSLKLIAGLGEGVVSTADGMTSESKVLGEYYLEVERKISVLTQNISGEGPRDRSK